MLVVGGGPAGRALAAETGRLGLRTVLLDQAPDAPWRHTYGSWVDELPPGLPPSVVAARASDSWAAAFRASPFAPVPKFSSF